MRRLLDSMALGVGYGVATLLVTSQLPYLGAFLAMVTLWSVIFYKMEY